MSIFICRWQNGDFSAVSARSREDAIILLDEVGNAEECELFTVKNFMVHFRLKLQASDVYEMVPVELEDFGEDTHDMLCDRLYPVYKKTILEVDNDVPDDQSMGQEQLSTALQRLGDAINTERQRQWGAKPPEISDDPSAALLQKAVHNLPKAAAERTVKENRRSQLFEMQPNTSTVQ